MDFAYPGGFAAVMEVRRARNCLYFSFSAAIHVAALYEYFFFADKDLTHPLIYQEFYFLLVASFVLSASLLLLRKGTLRQPLLCLHFMVLCICGYPLGMLIGVKTLLLAVWLIEAASLPSVLWSVVAASLSIVLFFLSSAQLIIFNKPIDAPDIHLVAENAFLALLVYPACRCVHVVFRRLGFLEARAHSLDLTIGALTTANKDFQQYAVVARENAEEEERNRITREIHDTIGYTFTNIIMMLESAVDYVPDQPARVISLLTTSRQQALKGLEDMRTTLRNLRKAGVKQPGILAISNLVKTFASATNIKITIEYGNLGWYLDEQLYSAIYHSIQEGLVNSLRHGNATEVKICLWYTGDDIKITIVDNGIGSHEIVPGIGFSGIGERLRKLNGTFKAFNVPGGFELLIEIPYRESMQCQR